MDFKPRGKAVPLEPDWLVKEWKDYVKKMAEMAL